MTQAAKIKSTKRIISFSTLATKNLLLKVIVFAFEASLECQDLRSEINSMVAIKAFRFNRPEEPVCKAVHEQWPRLRPQSTIVLPKRLSQREARYYLGRLVSSYMVVYSGSKMQWLDRFTGAIDYPWTAWDMPIKNRLRSDCFDGKK